MTRLQHEGRYSFFESIIDGECPDCGEPLAWTIPIYGLMDEMVDDEPEYRAHCCGRDIVGTIDKIVITLR